MNKHKISIRLTAAMAALLLAAQILPTPVQAASSSAIKEEINALKGEQKELQSQVNEIESQKNKNWESIEEKVEYKNSLDEQMFLLYSQVDNLNEQISSYSQLIAQTQTELDDAQNRYDELDEKNKERVRAMEEEGKFSYWSVLFKANSFTDFIDRLNMIEEIQTADQRRLEELDEAARQVADTKQTLSEEKTALEASMQELEAAQIELDEKRAETDEILAELNEEDQAYQAMLDEYEDEKASLIAEIAAAEVEYTKALAAEEAARKKAEEEARKKAEEEAKRQQASANQNTSSNSGSNGGSSSGSSGSGVSSTPPATGGWRQPCSYKYISSAYGSRGGGFHNGVDFAASSGTPIYASRSGTVTTATAKKDANGNYISYGNYVVINHGDGYSSLYAHMTYYVVSTGQHVSQGELIGYVGSTGNSSGPHLHFTVFYNGSTINPMSVL